ncbi:MAG: hypothetical protein LBS32_02695, partial [Clostridiales Family XIII bacterium]|nr:hypothetical protein [Clostridiales Family XIII bacterium]
GAAAILQFGVPRDFFACGENAHGGLNHKRFASLRVYDTIAAQGPRLFYSLECRAISSPAATTRLAD